MRITHKDERLCFCGQPLKGLFDCPCVLCIECCERYCLKDGTATCHQLSAHRQAEKAS